jgi:ABC-type multidrug transport system fused ATPase/permease subunit
MPPVESLPDDIPLGQLLPSTSSRPALMCFEGADISWSPDAPEPTLCSIDITIRPGFTGIVGPVASGKSTVLASIVGETILNRGVLTPIPSRVAFCSQTPWIMDNTVQHNITGGLALDQKWYDFSVSSCCLQEDVDGLPRGDQTVAGSNGMSLSGGQRQRLVSSPVFGRGVRRP